MPDPLPLSLPPGVRSKRRAVYAVGVVVLCEDKGGDDTPGYLGNWQPIRETKENPKREGWSWIAAHVIDWSSVG